jgi:hypothetical protein
LTVHYSNTAGQTKFEIVRLSQGDAAVLAALERDTGLRIDRSPTTTSFLGLPIHIAIGDTVYITDDTGRRAKGRVTQLSASSVGLQPSRQFDATAIQKIEVSDTIWDGASMGAFVSILPAGLVSFASCIESCSTFLAFSAGGWGVIAVGAVVGALIDASVLRNAYRRTEPGASRRVRWAPVLTGRGKGVQVSIQF